jgi:hypothetical protein
MPTLAVPMTVNRILVRAVYARTRAHLWRLRTSLTQARDALMHFKDDRVDRDKLEPAARRVDDLMNMFGSDLPDCEQGVRWLTEIQQGVGEVTNPKAADALNEARVDLTALLEVMGAAKTALQPIYRPT